MDLGISLINRGSVALCSPVWRLHRHRVQGGEKGGLPDLPVISIPTNERVRGEETSRRKWKVDDVFALNRVATIITLITCRTHNSESQVQTLRFVASTSY